MKGSVLEIRLLLHMQNTVCISYRMMSGAGPMHLELRPSLHLRMHNAPVNEPLQESYRVTIAGERCEISATPDLPPLRMLLHGMGGAPTVDGESVRNVFYRKEAERGYEARGVLWSPGYFSAALLPGQDVTLIASTEPWTTILALQVAEAQTAEQRRRQRLLAAAHAETPTATAAELVLAADQFIITPAGRVADAARARAAGDEECSIIASYHWFTDWGRDTMIGFEGLTLATGRYLEAGWILRTFARFIKDGLIPNLFPEGEYKGLYHTADATLWFFHAIDRYLAATRDRTMLTLVLPQLLDIIAYHRRGTHFGIGIDPQDGLLRQGQEGYQLTWMDAKVGDWVLTPRRGKAVEINALWYNALRLLEDGYGRSTAIRLHMASPRMRNRLGRPSTSAFGTPEGGICMTSSMAPRAAMPPAGRTRYSPSPYVIRFWIERAGSPSSPWCASVCSPRWASAHSLQAIRTISRGMMATFGRARPPIIKGPCGPGLSALSSMRGSGCIPRTALVPGASLRDSSHTWARRASARSVRSSMQSHRSRPVDV